MMEENQFTERESLQLIQQMINKAKGSYHDTGIGPILWGGVIAFCSLVSFAQVQFDFVFPFDVWLLTLIAIIPQIFITIREKRLRKVMKYEDITLSYIWMVFGVSIFLLIHINVNIYEHLNPIMNDYEQLKNINDSGFRYSTYSTSLFLLLYGIPTILTGGIMKLRSMLIGGIMCWVCCIVSVYTDIRTDLLLMAFSAIVMWLLPGIILWNRYGKNKTVVDV